MKITLNDVAKYYKSETNVSKGIQGITSEFSTGEIVAVTGESGSGKSTFLNVVSLMDTFEEGSLLYDDVDVATLSIEELETLRRNNVAFIFQNYKIIDSYTVLQNVMCPLLIKGMTHKDAKNKALEIIDKVGLSKRVNHKGTKLSGGEKQRCVIARALTSDSKVLACDEPTGNLDSKSGAEIMKLINDVSDGRIVFVVTHNFEQIMPYATRKIKFYDSKIIEDYKLKEITNTEEVKKEIIEKKGHFTLFNIALRNIFATPKRTWFSFIICFVISFVILTLLATTIQYSENKFYQDNAYYNNADVNRLVVYNRDGSQIDGSVIKNNINYKDSFENIVYSESKLVFRVGGQFGISYTGFYKKSLADSVLVYGRMPTGPRELVIGGQFDETSSEALLSSPVYSDREVNGRKDFTIVGIVESTVITFTGNDETNQILKEYAILSSIRDIPKNRLKYKVVQSDEKFIHVLSNKDMYRNNKLDGLEISYLAFAAKYYTINLYGYDYEYIESYENIVEISSAKIMEILDSDIRIGVIYSSIRNAKNDINNLGKLGYSVTWPAKAVSESNYYDSTKYLFTSIAMWAFVIVIIVILFLITYLILGRIYKTKVSEYVVFRTLGLSRKKSGYSVEIENILIYLAASVLCIGISNVLFAFWPKIFSFVIYIDFNLCVLFLLVMLFFSFFLAKKFNKSIFKFSIQETLRGGVLRD